ncbi:hypothetical protein HOH87_03250 [bacterium]|nr:hypothetical protein [bacterium]
MDNSDLTVTVARLSIRLSRVVDMLAMFVVFMIDILLFIVGSCGLIVLSFYRFKQIELLHLLAGEFVLLVLLYLLNKLFYKKLVTFFYKH